MFLGGMSLGACSCGRRTERITRPRSDDAIVELATGVIGLVFHDVSVATTSFVYSNVSRRGLGVAQTIVSGHRQPAHSAAVDCLALG